MGKLNLAVFISGRGSNMEAIAKACQVPGFPAQMSLVFSNKETAKGLQTANTMGIATETLSHKGYGSREDYERQVLKILDQYPVDLICLAGFMRVLSPVLVHAYEGRILNMHPSLLPKYKGLDPQKQALEAGEKESGCSVHIVTPELDDGPVLVQRKVPILPEDTEETLSARILEQEHLAYPEAIRVMAERISV